MPTSAPHHPLVSPSTPALAGLRLPQAPPGPWSPGSAAWQQPQLSASVMETAAAAGKRSLVTICQEAFLPPGLPSCPLLSHGPGEGPVSGWEGPEGIKVLSVLCGRAARGTNAGPNQGSCPPRTTHHTGCQESGRLPSESPPSAGRRRPQLEGGEIVPQTHWVTQLVRNQEQ